MTKQKLLNIISSGIDCNILSILQIADMEGLKGLENNTKALGWITLAKHKLLLNENGTLSPCGAVMLKGLREGQEFTLVENKEEPVKHDFPSWIISLHKKLQDKLVECTGKKQKVLQGKYSFLPNATDLGNKIEKVIKKYKIEDLDKIEKVLLQYIDKSHKAGFQMCMLIDYYILKSDSSKMMTDYELFDEKIDSEEKEVFIVKSIKDLF